MAVTDTGSVSVDDRLWTYTVLIYTTGAALAAASGGLAASQAPVWLTAMVAAAPVIGGVVLATVVFDRYE